MDWLIRNWFWIVLVVVFIGMHLFGHGGHGSHGRKEHNGGHGGGCGGSGVRKDESDQKRQHPMPEESQSREGHPHNH